jgi:L-ascorbate metabolism protein UlaG (beta-lactamase superfamily)
MMKMEWLGHAGFCFRSEKNVYFDPFQLTSARNDADVVFITHEHFDHCEVASLKQVLHKESIIVCPPDCVSKLKDLEFKDVLLVEPEKKYTVCGLSFETTFAYNVNKFRSPGLPYHPRGNNWVGYIVTIDSKRVYHMGDTDVIPELKNVKDIDVALVPVSGTYVMTPEEGAQAVGIFSPKIAVPMHYGAIVGTDADAKKFKELSSVPVQIMQKIVR